MAELQATLVNGVVTSVRTENQKSTSHTLELNDRDKVVAFIGTGAQTVTVPSDAAVNFPTGSVVYIGRFGSGSLQLTAAGGVSITRSGGFGENEEIYIRKRGANSWNVVDSPKNLTGDGGAVSAASGYTIHTFTSGTSSFTVS